MAIDEKVTEKPANKKNIFPFFEGKGPDRINYSYIALDDLCIKTRTTEINGKEILVDFDLQSPAEADKNYRLIKEGMIFYASHGILRTIPHQSGNYILSVTGYQERELSLNLE